jgi:vancomycin resistance protein YoaR
MSTVAETNTPTPQKKFHFKSKPVIIGAGIGGAVIVLLIAAIFLSSSPKDVISKGVFADNLDLGGMTQQEAQEALLASDFFAGKTLTLQANNATYSLDSEAIELKLDAEATAKNAFLICKSGNRFQDGMQALKLKFSKKQIPLIPSMNEEKLNEHLFSFGAQTYGELKEHAVELTDTTMVITPGVSGISQNFDVARRQITDALSKQQFEGISITFDKESPKALTGDTLYESQRRDPQNAYYKSEGKSLTIVPEVPGVDFDRQEAEKLLKNLKEGAEPVSIPIRRAQAEVTKENLQKRLFNATISSFSTKYSASNTNRSHNLALAAGNMNGTILAPGDVFSYNDVVGARTKANGFKNAAVYENGKSVDGIGGGVCQVSTTLYSAVLYADLEIVSRQNHSLTVSYVPLGQDATVVDGAIDFKFKNNMDYPIKIVSGASNGTISVSIVGTQRDVPRTVKLSHKTVSTTEPTMKEIPDPSLPAGTQKVTSHGKKGYVVSSTKTVYENGEVVNTVSLGRSTYKMVPGEVLVGKGAQAAASPSATPVPAEAPVEEPPVIE